MVQLLRNVAMVSMGVNAVDSVKTAQNKTSHHLPRINKQWYPSLTTVIPRGTGSRYGTSPHTGRYSEATPQKGV